MTHAHIPDQYHCAYEFIYIIIIIIILCVYCSDCVSRARAPVMHITTYHTIIYLLGRLTAYTVGGVHNKFNTPMFSIILLILLTVLVLVATAVAITVVVVPVSENNNNNNNNNKQCDISVFIIIRHNTKNTFIIILLSLS